MELKAIMTLSATGIIVSSICLTGLVSYANETKKNEESLVDISNQLAALKLDIQNLKKSLDENYEKRFKELADAIAEIDKEFEEVRYENESIIFEAEILEAEQEYSKERLPVGVDTNRYDCEPYTFGAGSDQYWLQTNCFTDERGLRYFYHNGKKYYCVAMGGAYGIDIGDTWDVTLECGTEFGIILSDYQHSVDDVDPNDFGECYERDIYGNIIDVLRNYDGEPVVHVLEFVVDLDILPKYVFEAGTVSAFEEFGGLYGNGGNIVDISYNRRLWSV